MGNSSPPVSAPPAPSALFPSSSNPSSPQQDASEQAAPATINQLFVNLFDAYKKKQFLEKELTDTEWEVYYAAYLVVVHCKDNNISLETYIVNNIAEIYAFWEQICFQIKDYEQND